MARPHTLKKKRTDQGIIHRGPVGEVGPKVVIIDDMIDTGGTLVSACENLRAAGAQQIYILVTHGLFTGTSWMQVWSLGVKQIFCTDTVTLHQAIEVGNISVVAIAPMIREVLNKYQSVPPMSVQEK